MSSPLLKDKENYDIIDDLGSGAYGTVLRIKSKKDGKEYALKSINLKKLKKQDEKDALLQESICEYKLLKNNFANVVRAYGSFFDNEKEKFLFSMDFHPQNFNEFVQKLASQGKYLKFNDFLPILLDILTGLRNLYIQGKTIHRDIKPENILITKDGRAVIADVGVAKTFTNQTLTRILKDVTSVAGTDQWMPPEMLSLKTNDFSIELDIDQSKLDVFSLGLLTLFALDYKNFIAAQSDLNKNPRKLSKYLTSFRPNIPDDFYYILRCMLSFSNSTRPDLEELHGDISRLSRSLSSQNPVSKPLSQPRPQLQKEHVPVPQAFKCDYPQLLREKVAPALAKNFDGLLQGVKDNDYVRIENESFPK